VTLMVFKTIAGSNTSWVGSIPIHLRQLFLKLLRSFKILSFDLKKIPAVGKLLETEELKNTSYPRAIVKFFTLNLLNKIRNKRIQNISSNANENNILNNIPETILKFIPSQIEKKAINGTGIILHTGLGRAPLSESAKQSLMDAAGYNLVQSDREGDSRALREELIEDIIKELTHAESTTVVNNNAAATFLMLDTHCKGKEVIISRGQLVEIGGSYRIPDIIKQSGCILKEIGTTNKTHLIDYKKAITENTGAILFVHHSNFKISGFTSEPSIEELCELGQEMKIPVMADLGSGALTNLEEWGLPHEITVKEIIKAGVFACSYSGDKLIGGPQAGIISGKKESIEKIRKSDFSRMFRVCKLTLRALEATLLEFLDQKNLSKNIPIYQFLSCKIEDLNQRALKIINSIDYKNCSNLETKSYLGGGSIPESAIKSISLCFSFKTESESSIFAKSLRFSNPAVFSKHSNSKVYLDLRSITPEEDSVLINVLQNLN
jgi:L-seryl-tRNA(Ser) seleniumtransferase